MISKRLLLTPKNAPQTPAEQFYALDTEITKSE